MDVFEVATPSTGPLLPSLTGKVPLSGADILAPQMLQEYRFPGAAAVVTLLWRHSPASILTPIILKNLAYCYTSA